MLDDLPSHSIPSWCGRTKRQCWWFGSTVATLAQVQEPILCMCVWFIASGFEPQEKPSPSNSLATKILKGAVFPAVKAPSATGAASVFQSPYLSPQHKAWQVARFVETCPLRNSHSSRQLCAHESPSAQRQLPKQAMEDRHMLCSLRQIRLSQHESLTRN